MTKSIQPLPSEAMLTPWLEAAKAAAEKAHAPYSNFAVGAALVLSDGRIVPGCNIENASFGVTLCAERVAASAAIAAGDRDWRAIVVVSPTGVSPCGACRQFLSEFAPTLAVYYGRVDAAASALTAARLDELLPDQMRLG